MADLHPIHYHDYGPLQRLIASRDYTKVAIIVDDNTAYHCLPKLKDHLDSAVEVIEIKSGEAHKNIATCAMIWQRMLDLGLDRHSLIINLGGGVVGDMGGFCAATYMRGIDFVQVPTSLLAQVDASVGGKLGVDLNATKNMIGAIINPTMVVVDTGYLSTLPHKQLRSGYAEVLKHGLIRQAPYWQERSAANWSATNDWAGIVKTSIEIKSEVVQQDPREEGLRKVLNFGHTIGHALETYHMNTDGHLLHGEAIAIGMICEAHISHRKGFLPQQDLQSISSGLLAVFGHEPSHIVPVKSLLPLLRLDKKNKAGQIRCTLLKAIGTAIYDQVIDQEDVAAALDYYASEIS